MSGEGGGIIIGGIVVLAAAPVVLGVAATAAVGVGVYHLARIGVREARKASDRRQIRINQCSEELSSLYTEINRQLADQEQSEKQIREKLCLRAEQAADELETFCKSAPSTSDMIRRTNTFREEMQRLFTEGREDETERVREETRSRTASLISALEEAESSRQETIRWKDNTQAAKNMQRAYAESLLIDARASVEMAKSIAARAASEGFSGEVDILKESLAAAETSFRNGMYEGTAAQSQKIVTTCARIVMEEEQEAMRVRERRTDLLMLTEALSEEVRARRQVTFELPQKDGGKKTVEEDLADFSQGKLEELQESVGRLKAALESGEQTESSLRLLRRQYEALRGNANTILSVAGKEMIKYYDRLYALEIISDAMKKQNYKVDWALPEGDDPTQKLVVHFTNTVSSNTVSVTLDQDMNSQDVKQLAMDILFYYGSGAPVPEAEKARIRAYLDTELSKAGLQADVNHCKGAVNQPSPDTTYDEEEQVMEKKPRKLFRA